jgi:multicomponent K+:H+ antiporter subunit A
VALVQIVVDILSVVILVLALTRLPRERRHRARALTFLQSRPSLVRDAIIAVVAGGVMTVMTLVALTSRPRTAVATPFFEANAKPLTGAKDIVGAIVVDFRALDTLIEIAVFSLAGLAIYTLLRYAAGRHAPAEPAPAGSRLTQARPLPSLGISGAVASPLIRVLASIALPLALVIAAVHMMYGHDQPGDGFTAGVIVSLAVGFWYIVFGYDEVRQRLTWLRPRPLIAAGLLLAILNGTVSSLVNGAFLTNTDYGTLIGLSLPAGFYFSSSFLFEVAICLSVLGSAATIMNTLGHPEEEVSSG